MNNQQQINTGSEPKKTSLKWKIYAVLLVILLGAGAYGYWWRQKTNTLRVEAEAVIEQAQRYDTLQSAVKNERTRCENFIAQKEGDFGSFEYCKKLIDWSDTLPLVK
ncbi:hypothetical protein KKG24_03570 [Patescibacteria group bacterium]|nr:hypothetical protein [Patescibacteria group bacterium]